MSTELKLIENLTAQNEINEQLLDKANEQIALYEDMRKTDSKIIAILEAQVLTLKALKDA